MKSLLNDAAARGTAYLDSLRERRVSPQPGAITALASLHRPLQEEPVQPSRVLEELDALGSPATMASAGGRFFGFVVGASLPAALAANVLAAAWDQNAGLEALSPINATLERVSRDWLVDVLGLPASTEVGFVTGATLANFTALAAARHAQLEAQGWDVEARGLFGAPPITVIVGDEVHVSLLKALSMLGLGRERVVRVPVDDQGRMVAAEMPRIAGPTIVCAQAGNVNSGAFDPLADVAARLEGTGAWLHVDAAFGLWAAASPSLRKLTAGMNRADSISTDAHKWLNVPYDSGIVFVRDKRHLNAAMSVSAAYLVEGESRDPHLFVPEMSRRARGIEVWAALRSLGKSGLAAM
ncbi:MAG: pyridoxal-dependent decarboxylase, partial [Candidatus Krumholzibacteria bacterium]|nr:pyridoxal-dependent decarboxylase [Candidatus Krumholzibacteria bacterium]